MNTLQSIALGQGLKPFEGITHKGQILLLRVFGDMVIVLLRVVGHLLQILCREVAGICNRREDRDKGRVHPPDVGPVDSVEERVAHDLVYAVAAQSHLWRANQSVVTS